MFGLFKKKPTKEEFEASIKDGSVYPKDSIAVLQIQTESGQPATAWINQGYKDYKYKMYCPSFYKLEIGYSQISEAALENLDMGTIEDYLEEELKKVGIVHMIARFVTDNGMDILLYTEPKEEFENLINELSEKNRLNIDIAAELHPEDTKWKSMKMILG